MAFRYEITKAVGTLSTNRNGTYAKEVNYISYEGRPPVLDIRKWDKKNGTMLKGITLDASEAKALRELLDELDTEEFFESAEVKKAFAELEAEID